MISVPPPQRVDDEAIEHLIDRMMVANSERVEMPVSKFLDVLSDLRDLRAAFGGPSDPLERLNWHLERIYEEFEAKT